jgi:EAL domain-containing protein (putative c-di-GMP-specific phosphodiesterase class I)
VGYGALNRFADGTPPDVVFALAVRAGLGIEMETATLGAALEAAAILPPGAYLSLNASPALVASAEVKALRGLAVGSGQGYLLGRPQDSRGSGSWPTKIALPAS